MRRLLLVAMGLALSGSVTSAQQASGCVNLPPGLVAWWPGDGSGDDFAGTNNAALSAAFGLGIAGPAFKFDGVDDYIEIANSPALHSERELTVAGWFRVSSFPVEWMALFFKGNLPDCPDWPNCSNREYGLWLHSSGKAEFTSTASGADAQTSASTAAEVVIVDQWHHFAAVISCNSGYMKLYINGTQAAEFPYSTNGIRSSSEALFLGSAARIGGTHFNGLLDEFAIFNTALTSNQIAAMHAAGSFGMCKPQSPPRIAVPPESQCVFEDEDVVLAVAASGTPLFFQWRRNGLLIANATNSSLRLSDLAGDRNGEYDAVVTNSLGSATSAVASVSFVARPTVFREDFECLGANKLPSGWSVVNGLWEAGVPTYGPPTNLTGSRAFAGTNVAGTVLGGNYYDGVAAWLYSPSFAVPTNNPRLCFWHWYAFSCADYGEVYIKPETADWTYLARYGSYNGGVWTPACFDLNAYGGQTVQLGFYLWTYDWGPCEGPDVGPGWYIDELAVVTGPSRTLLPNTPESFETGWGDWHVEGGTWEIGVPTYGPSSAGTGTNVAATLLASDYFDGTLGRLVSPPLVVPAAEENPRLWFRHWYAINWGDVAQVQIKTPTDGWTDLGAPLANGVSSDGIWTNAILDLRAYAGQTVQLGFYFSAITWFPYGPDTAPGWYIDEVTLLTDLTLRIGSGIVHTQTVAQLPLTIYSSYDLAEMEFALEVPAEHLAGVSLIATNPALTASVQTAPDGRWRFAVSADEFGALTGAIAIGNIQFTAVAGQSTIIPLVLKNISGLTRTGTAVTNGSAINGRLVIIANRPLLEILGGSNAEPTLLIYGVPGTTNRIESTTVLSETATASAWQTQFRIPTPPTFLETRFINPTDQSTFYRAVIDQ